MKINITPVRTREEAEQVQLVFNHKSCIQWLGAFTRLEQLWPVKHAPAGFWKAEVDGKIVGGHQMAHRKQAHLASFGEVGVLEEYRRKRIGTCLYAAVIFQCVMEGRRVIEDTIVADNPSQFAALPKIRVMQTGVMPMRTASFKDIAHFHWVLSIEAMHVVLNRMPADVTIELVEDYYTRDLMAKNLMIIEKKKPEFAEVVEKANEMIRSDSRIRIVAGPEHPVGDRRPRKQQSTQQTLC